MDRGKFPNSLSYKYYEFTITAHMFSTKHILHTYVCRSMHVTEEPYHIRSTLDLAQNNAKLGKMI